MNIASIGAWGRNYGDRAIERGVMKALSGHAVTPIDCQSVTFHDADRAKYMNRTFDAVVVGGGGLLWDKPELKSRSGWQWQVTMEFLEALRIPIIVWGIGWTRFSHDEDTTGYAPEFAETLGWLTEHADAFTVRNHETAIVLDRLGISVPGRVGIVDDVAFGAPWGRPGMPIGQVLALCWASDKKPWRWPSAQAEEEALQNVADTARTLGMTVRVVEHIAGMDGGVRQTLRAMGARIESVEESHSWLYPAMINHVKDWARIAYSTASVVLSMRKHGMLIPAAMGVPVVAMGNLSEVQWLADGIGAPFVPPGAGLDEYVRAVKYAAPIEEKYLLRGRRSNALLRETVDNL